MLIFQDKKSESEPIHHNVNLGENASDLLPAYDALSLHQPANDDLDRYTGTSAVPLIVSSNDLSRSDLASLSLPVSNIDRPLPLPPLDNTPSTPRNASPSLTQRLRASKNTSWLSLLPFVSSFSAKQVRQSILSTVSDLVLPLSRTSNEEEKSAHKILVCVAEICAQHKVSLSGVLQEAFIADHTPMYWAIINYRQELLVALLIHSRPLSIQSISEIRRACLISSNQALFHALRVCSPPFHRTDGIQVPNLRMAANNLLLGDQPLDEIRVQHTSGEGFVVSFDIPLWQRRMRAIGQVEVEFIASGRMWSVTFFSTDPSLSIAASGKSKKAKQNTWHVMISLLESSLPTYFDSELVVDIPSPAVPKSKDNGPSSSSFNVPPPAPPLQGSLSSSSLNTPSITIHLGCDERKLGCRASSVELLKTPMMKPSRWSDHGVGYTNAVVSPLGEAHESLLLSEHSQYLLPDGTLRARLEARLTKTESSGNCVIC